MTKDQCSIYLDNKNVINAFNSGDEARCHQVFSCLHQLYHARFMNRLPVFESNNVALETLKRIAEEQFNDALLRMKENSMSGIFSIEGGDCKNYLYAIFKNFFMNAYRKELTAQLHKKNYAAMQRTAPHYAHNMQLSNSPNDVYAVLRMALAKQSISCQQIMGKDLFAGINDNDIATTLNFKTVNVYRSARSRCRQSLLETLNKDFGFNFN